MKNSFAASWRCCCLAGGAAGAGGRQGARDHRRLGRARDRARRRPGRRLHRDHRAAGRASRRCEAEPRRARAHADLVVANGAELEIGWLPVLLQESGNTQHPARRAGLFRGDVGAEAARGAGEARPRDGRHPSAGQSARPARSAQHRDGREGADGAARRDRSRRRATTTQRAARISASAGRRGDRALGGEGRAAQGRAGRDHASRPGLSVPLARPQGACRDRAEARRAADAPATSAQLVTKLSRVAADADPAAMPTTIRRRPTGCPSACTRRPSCCRSRSAARPERRTCSGSSTTRSTSCWRR